MSFVRELQTLTLLYTHMYMYMYILTDEVFRLEGVKCESHDGLGEREPADFGSRVRVPYRHGIGTQHNRNQVPTGILE